MTLLASHDHTRVTVLPASLPLAPLLLVGEWPGDEAAVSHDLTCISCFPPLLWPVQPNSGD